MPWSKDNLPAAAKKLKGHAIDIFVATANSILKTTGDEGRAIASGLVAARKYHEKGVMATTKKEGSESLSASDFAYVPDKTSPSTWKLRIDDARHVAAAVAALGKGFRGKKVQIPAEDLAAVKAKVRAAHKKFFPDAETPPVLIQKSLKFSINEREVLSPDLISQLVSAVAGFFRQKEWKEEYTEAEEAYAEGMLFGVEYDDIAEEYEDEEVDDDLMPILKQYNKELRQATYVVLSPEDTDLHGDIYSEEEIRKACHNFNTQCGKAFINHETPTDGAAFVESYIAPVAMKIGEVNVKKGAWITVAQFDEKLWNQVKDGTFNGVSIGAMAVVEEIK